MTTVVREGTGRNAAIPGYEVAGKTGTAQKLDPATHRYSRAPGVLSFVGFAPAEDPRLAMLVMLDEPKTEKWGSEAAAPIFAAIGREALGHMGVARRDTPPVQIVSSEGGEPAGAGVAAPPATVPARRAALSAEVDGAPAMPALQGLSLRQAMQSLALLDVSLEVSGRGVVVAQAPAPGAPLTSGTVARLTLASPATRP
jgi:cell division protein FtsI (penicillin-binding protein 3)